MSQRGPTTQQWLAAANAARAAGDGERAQDAYLVVLEREPAQFDALFGMATLAEGAGDGDAATHYYARLVAAAADDARAWFAAGNFHARRYDFSAARDCYQRALERQPQAAGIWINLGNVEKYRGDLKAATACYDRAVACDPDNAALNSNALLSLHYDPTVTHEEMFARHAAWAQRHAAPRLPASSRWGNARDPERALRIGYVSEGFDGRVLAHFLRGFLPHHDRSRHVLYAYSNGRHPDAFTAELRKAFDHWREIRNVDDAAVADAIRADAIDVLIDLDGHVPDSRLRVFAHKPAPVQVTWLGYWNTTGMATIDYILTDPATTPADTLQRFTEKPLFLPASRFCYAPVPYAPPVAPSPCLQREAFTFGSFNRYDKLGPDVIRTWAAILRQVPASRLIIKNTAIAIPYVREVLLRQFGELGIAADRIELRARSPHAEMLAEYAEIDLALDSFPYNGGLTTCEALWQGVPVLAIEQERMIGRQSAGMLRAIGAEGFIARDEADYVSLAARWAGQREALSAIRVAQRERMRVSALCDGRRFARDLEAVLRDAWRACCAKEARR